MHQADNLESHPGVDLYRIILSDAKSLKSEPILRNVRANFTNLGEMSERDKELSVYFTGKCQSQLHEM